jgi:hypothetical protein
MKNLLKIPKLNLSRFLKPTKVFAVAVLLPLWGLGGFSCSLVDALKPTPQIDQYGLDKNATFACLVNGQKWEPGKSTFLMSSLRIEYYKPLPNVPPNQYNGGLFINASNSQTLVYDILGISIEGYTVPKMYNVKNIEDKITLNFYDLIQYPSHLSKKVPDAFEGYVNITSFTPLAGSTGAKILKGTFEFKTLDHKGDTLHITAGRFNYGN